MTEAKQNSNAPSPSEFPLNLPESFKAIGSGPMLVRATELWMSTTRCEMVLQIVNSIPSLAWASQTISMEKQREITDTIPELRGVKPILDQLIPWPIVPVRPNLEPPEGEIPPVDHPEYLDLICGMTSVLTRDVEILVRAGAIAKHLTERNRIPVWEHLSFLGRPVARSAGVTLGFPPAHKSAIAIFPVMDRRIKRLWKSIGCDRRSRPWEQ